MEGSQRGGKGPQRGQGGKGQRGGSSSSSPRPSSSPSPSSSSSSPAAAAASGAPRKRAEASAEAPSSSVPFVDTHCHLDMIYERERHRGTFAQFRERHPFPPNFDAAITIFCDPAAFSPSLGIWREVIEEPGVFACFGIHPHNARFYTDALEERIVEAMGHPKALAWGECGLDYHYNNSPQDVQREVFARQIRKAVELGKPLVVHSREAEEDTLFLLQDHLPREWPVHMHCHSGSDEFTLQLLRGFPNMAFGFTGALTFANAQQRKKVAEVVPLERILLETDGPYMAPNPFRGRTAHPGQILYIAQQVALLKHLPLDRVLTTIRDNTRRVYGI